MFIFIPLGILLFIIPIKYRKHLGTLQIVVAIIWGLLTLQGNKVDYDLLKIFGIFIVPLWCLGSIYGLHKNQKELKEELFYISLKQKD